MSSRRRDFKLRRVYFRPSGQMLRVFTAKCCWCGRHSGVWRSPSRWPNRPRFWHYACLLKWAEEHAALATKRPRTVAEELAQAGYIVDPDTGALVGPNGVMFPLVTVEPAPKAMVQP